MFIREVYRKEAQKFRERYLKLFLIFLAFSAFLVFLGYEAAVMNADHVDDFLKGLRDSVGGQERVNEINQSKGGLFVFLLLNNLRILAATFVLGVVPFYVLPIVLTSFSVLVIGVVVGISTIKGEDVFQRILTDLLPHFFTEYSALLITVVLSMVLSHASTKLLFRRMKWVDYKKVFVDSATTFLAVCVPLILVSAVIEAFITSSL